jgi:hypothetical protein
MSTHLPKHSSAEIQTVERTASGENDAVFVDVVQSVQNVKGVSLPSFVRLYSLKCVEGIISQEALLFDSSKQGFVFTGFVPDRKLALPIRSLHLKRDQHELPAQMVEGAPKVLDRISDDCSDAIGNARDTINLINHLRLYLFGDAIGLGSEEGLDCRPKFDEVLFGPFKFQPDESKPFVEIHSSRSSIGRHRLR